MELPPDNQTAEFQLAHGMIDLVVPRAQMRVTLASLLRWVAGRGGPPCQPGRPRAGSPFPEMKVEV
jgi:acetyl-CoA carboxylase carboxyl transferase subunit beta